MKSLTLILGLAFILLFSNTIEAQLRVDQYGRIGLGTNFPNPGYKLHIKGDLLLTTYPEIPAPNTTFVEFKFKVGNGWPGAEFGTNVDKVACWSSETGYNELYAEDFYSMSDSTQKTNIQRVENSLEKIKQLKSYSYNVKGKNERDNRRKFGFLAQEVQKVLPEVTDTAKGITLISYQQIVPLLAAALNEQQKEIEGLKEELAQVKSEMVSCCNQNHSGSTLNGQSQGTAAPNVEVLGAASSIGSKLFQNRPNPFTEQSIIEFDIVGKFSSASILIFDMQGTLKRTIPVNESGKGQITIYANSLNAGMYLYSLVIDGKEIDTKRMILMN